MDDTELLTTEQAASILQISIRRVQQLAEEKRIEGKKVGRDWLFSRQAVGAFKAQTRKVGRPSKK